MALGRLAALMLFAGLVLPCSASPSTIPVPPQQSAAWQAPKSKLPAQLLDDTRELFDLGFNDPRGCDYREVALQIGHNDMYDPKPAELKTHAWLLPADPAASTRFAIGWNGVIYPVASVGAPADLEADIGKLLAQDNAGIQAPEKFDGRPSWDDSEDLAIDRLRLGKIPLLVRLGKGELAQGVWDHWNKRLEASIAPPTKEERALTDLFTQVAQTWLWANYFNALQAHIEGNPQLALAYFQVITGCRSKVEHIARQRGMAIKTSPGIQLPGHTLDLTFLDQLPALLSDEERRIKEAAAQPGEGTNPGMEPDKKKRIAALVRELENVKAKPTSIPGYINFRYDPVVFALINEGEDAVEPLIDCLDHDQRFTQSLDYWRVVGVEEPAFAALQGILKIQNQLPSLDEPYVNCREGGPVFLERTALAAKVRDYWKKYHGQSQAERWYGVLLDDHAAPQAWGEAAGNIVLPGDAVLEGGGALFFGGRQLDGSKGLLGDALRNKTNPSVSELLVKRLREVWAKQPLQSPTKYSPAGRLAPALAKWDGKNQVETLRWYWNNLQKLELPQGPNYGAGGEDDLIATYLERFEAGDPQVPADYAKWMRSLNATQIRELIDGSGGGSNGIGGSLFAPLWSYPDDPVMIETARWLFQDPASPLLQAPADPTWVVNVAHHRLLGLAVFRSLVLQMLKDKTVIGHAEVTDPGQGGITYNKTPTTGDWMEAGTAPVGTKEDIRVCDAIAHSIARIGGAPEYELYWKTEQRDAALQKTVAFLGRYGDRLLQKTTADEVDGPFLPDLSISFAPLDHPATQADLEAGRAIFSMEGKGERKVWSMPQFPLHANWMALKDFPTMALKLDPATGKSDYQQTGYDQEGTIWQAEDVLINGKWQRFFGFVGKNGMAAVPGDEIEIETGYANRFGNGWGTWIELNRMNETGGKIDPPKIKSGDPFPAQLWLENLTGAERKAPTAARTPGPISAKELGVEIYLEYSPLARSFTISRDTKWERINPNDSATVGLSAENQPLPSLEKTSLLDFDLAHYFPALKPGTYHVMINFTDEKLIRAKGIISSRDFEVTR